MADLRERKAESKLMRYCPHTETIGTQHECEACWGCPECGDAGRIHRVRNRRVLVCSECEQGFFKRADFKAHECHDAY